jgi:prepilin-type N-terminal cleavage/methylation domain-containing protein
MKNLNHNKSQRGFTLVEVIVVAIIVAALAGVAIPMYNNYVKTSRSNAAANAAGSVASWLGQCLSQQGAATSDSLSANSQTNGKNPITIKCTAQISGADSVISTMALPPQIKFTVTNLKGNGTVKAEHVDGSDIATYAY